ncbi:MAG: ABC transporter permease [Pseudomonadota bacterium]
MKWLKLAYANVLRNKRRTVITILITAIGMTSLLVGGGFANFTYQGLREMAARDSGHVIISHKNFVDKEEEVPMQYGIDNYQVLANEIRKNKDIRFALPRIEFSGLISNGDKSSIFLGTGVDPAGEFKVKGPFLTMVEGSVLSRREKLDEPKVIIGKGMAKSMGVSVGDSLTLMGTTTEGSLNALDVTIQGIMTTGVPEMDKRAIYVNIQTAQALLQTEKVSTLSIYLRSTDDTDAIQDYLQAQHPEYGYQTWLVKAFYYFGVKGIYDRIFGVLGVVILIMVFFSISNTVSMSVLERTREIGTLRAMGTHQWEVVRGFTLEGLVIGSFGSVLGTILGFAISMLFHVLDLQMPPPPGRSDSYPLAIDIPLVLYGTAILMSITVCMVAAWLAARKASSKSIVEALTHV